MENLRWILLLLGLGVIALVYALSRYQSRKRQLAEKPLDIVETSVVTDVPDDDAVQAELARMQSLVREQQTEPPPASGADSEQLIVLSVMAGADELFEGPALLRAFENTHLQYCDLQIYQRLTDNGEAVFGVASAVKPGVFVPEQMDSFTTPGLTLFLQLPGPADGVAAFDDMLTTAERLAVELAGELQDQNHSVLSRQTVAHLREGIINARLHQSARPAP